MAQKATALMMLFLLPMWSPAEARLPDVPWSRVFTVDEQGTIYTSSGRHYICQFTPEGELIHCFGGKGDGPSTILRLGWFAINPLDGHLYVTELREGHRWISIFDNEGVYQGEWKIDFDWTRGFGLSTIFFDPAGNGYILAMKNHMRPHRDYKIGSTERLILKFAPDGTFVREIYRFESDFCVESGGRGNITIPFHNYLHFTVASTFIAIRESKSRYIDVYDLNGNPVRKLSLPFARRGLTERDREDWYARIESFRTSRPQWDIDFWKKRMPFPETRPVSGRPLLHDGAGVLLSKNYTGLNETEPSIWVRIDPRSGQTTRQEMPNDERLLLVKNGEAYVYVMENDDEGVVVRRARGDHPFARRGGKNDER